MRHVAALCAGSNTIMATTAYNQAQFNATGHLGLGLSLLPGLLLIGSPGARGLDC